jgi:hypothetical protein
LASLLVSLDHAKRCIRDPSEKQKLIKTKTSMVLGVAWYREADWPRIKALFPDADELHESYAEWLESAKASMKRLSHPGVNVEPFAIDIRSAALKWPMNIPNTMD